MHGFPVCASAKGKAKGRKHCWLSALSKLFVEETVYRFGVILLTGLGDGLGLLGMVHGIGGKLGFQCHTGVLAIVYAALTGFVQEIA